MHGFNVGEEAFKESIHSGQSKGIQLKSSSKNSEKFQPGFALIIEPHPEEYLEQQVRIASTNANLEKKNQAEKIFFDQQEAVTIVTRKKEVNEAQKIFFNVDADLSGGFSVTW